MPRRGERHVPSHAVVDLVVVAAARLFPDLHPPALGTLCSMGDGHGVVLGRAYHDATADGLGLGVTLAGAGALRRVWRLGPHSGRTPTAPGARARAAGPLGALSPRGD